jgi:hypothetical protein
MKRYRGSDQVKMGFYWNPSRWDIVTIAKGGGILPGNDDVSYVRIPLIFVMLLGPLVGAVYVIFLPFIGFAMFFGFAGKKLLSTARRALGSRFVEAEVTTRQER